jgi:hypothetical protein
MSEEAILDTPVDDAVAVDETPIDDVQEVAADADAAVDADAEETPQDADVDPAKPAAPLLPKQVQAALKAFRESSPENAKIARALQDSYMHDQALTKSFPKGLSEAIALKTMVDGAGGTEGFANLQQRSALLEQIDANIAASDPGVLDSIIADSPEGFKGLVPHVLEKYEGLDQKGFATTVVQPMTIRGLEAAGFSEVMGEIATALKNGNTEAAMQRLKQVENWYANLKGSVAQGQQHKSDPERDKLTSDRQAFETDKYNNHIQSVFNEFSAYRTTLFNKAAGAYTKGLSADAIADLKEGYDKELSRAMSSDKVYASNVKGIMKQQDKEKAVSYINAKQTELYAAAFKTVWQRRYGTLPAGLKKAAPAKGVLQGVKQTTVPGAGEKAAPTSSNKAVLVNRAFKRAELDRAKDPGGLLYMTNQGYPLSGSFKGRLIKWK